MRKDLQIINPAVVKYEKTGIIDNKELRKITTLIGFCNWKKLYEIVYATTKVKGWKIVYADTDVFYVVPDINACSARVLSSALKKEGIIHKINKLDGMIILGKKKYIDLLNNYSCSVHGYAIMSRCY